MITCHIKRLIITVEVITREDKDNQEQYMKIMATDYITNPQGETGNTQGGFS